MEKPEGESFATLFNALVKSLQTLCHGHLEFNNGIEIIGHINLSVDKNSSMHYILEEKVCKNEENSTLFISKSFHAQHQKPDPKTRNDSENSRDGNATVDRSIDDEESTAISSISSALTKHEKSRLGSTLHSKEYDNLHSKSKTITNTAKRKASSDYSNDTRTAKSSHFSSSPSPVSHFLSSHSPHAASNPSSPVDTKPSIRQLQCEDMAGTVLPQTATVSGDNAGDLGVNLAGSVLERVDDHSNSDLPDRGDDSDGDLEVTFIKEEYVEGEQSACQFETSGGHHYGRGTHQRASSSDMHDASMYPVSLHHSASSTFVPSHDMTAAHHYGPSTSSQPQPGTSGVRGDFNKGSIVHGHQANQFANASESIVLRDRKKQDAYIERQNKWALSIFKDWLIQEQMPVEFEAKPVEEIDNIMSQFFQGARKKNGDPFSVSALLALRTALTRHLKGPPFYRNITLAKDERMKQSQHSFEQQMAEAGMCQSVTKAERITPEDYTQLYQSGVLGNNDPTSLLYKVWFELQYHFGRPGGRKSWGSVPAESFLFDSDTSGEFVCMRLISFASNSCTGGRFGPKMYAQDGPLCPVHSLRLYLQKRNPHCDAFLQVPDKNFVKEGKVWYKPEGLKEYKLSGLMKDISAKAQLSKSYTNLSVSHGSVHVLPSIIHFE